jgi:hypothetical protein
MSGSGSPTQYDVVVVGGGPAGCSAGVFTARYGFDTAIFDRGNAALRRSAYLANYLGFPAGIDIDTFYALIHDHVEEAGCTLIDDMVVSVDRPSDTDATADQDGEGDSRFLVETQDGQRVTATWVIAAAWYDGEYMRPLGGEEMFETHEHHGETEERFDPEYPDANGRTPVEGLYVAAPTEARNAQAVISAGQGAHVARCLLEDHRRSVGYPEGVVSAHYDWLRPESEFQGEWDDRDRWREWFANELPDDHDLDQARLEELRERYIDQAFETKLSEGEIERRTERGHRRLIERLDDDLVVERAREIQSSRNGDSEAENPARTDPSDG